MPFDPTYVANMTKETATGTGLSNLALQGGVTGYRSFADAIPIGSKVAYVVRDGDAWEAGFGTLVSSAELSRDTVVDSSATATLVNNIDAGSPQKLSLSAGTHTVICDLIAQQVLAVGADGSLQDPTPFRATIAIENIDALEAEEGMSEDETVFVRHGAATGDGLGGWFYWDPDDVSAGDGVDTIESNIETGLWKRLRPAIREYFDDEFVGDAVTANGARITLYSDVKASNANKWFRWLSDRAASAMRFSARLNQAGETNILSFFSIGDTRDRLETHSPLVLSTRTNSTDMAVRSLSWLSGVSRLALSLATPTAGAAATYAEIPLTKGGYLVGIYAAKTELKAVDAAAVFENGARALVMGDSAFGDCPAFLVEWTAASSAAEDLANVFRPSTGAAASGNGRWLRSSTSVSRAFTSGDATPSVKNGDFWVTDGATTITDFDDQYEGQTIVVARGASDISIANGINIVTCNGVDITLTATRMTAAFKSVGGVWYEYASSSGIIAGSVVLTSALTPSQITSNQNNYAPSNLAGKSVVRISSDAARNITGLTGGADGRVLVLQNVGSFAITLKDESTSSTGANRFALTQDLQIKADGVALLQYDGTAQRWRAIGGGAADSDTVTLASLGAVGDGTTDDTTAITAAAATGKHVYGDPSKTYLMTAGVTPAAGTHFHNCRFKMKLGSGGFNVTALGTLNTTTVAFHWDNVDGGGITDCEFFGDGGGEYMCMAVRVNLGMSTKPFICGGFNHFHDLPSAWRGVMNVVSVGAAGLEGNVLRFENFGTTQAANGAYWSSVTFTQSTGLSIDEGAISNAWSQRIYIERVEIKNGLNTGASFLAHGGQSDGIGVVGGGTEQDRDFWIGEVIGDGIDELVDSSAEHVHFGLVRGKNIRFCIYKLVHGARWNTVQHVHAAGPVARCIVGMFGSTSAPHSTRDNVVMSCTGEGVGEYLLDSGTAQGGAAGTITLKAGSINLTAGFNHVVRLTGGTGAGQERIINAWNNSTKVAGVTVNFSPAPDNTTTYKLLPFSERAAIVFENEGTSQVSGNVVNGVQVRNLGLMDYIVRSNCASNRDNVVNVQRDGSFSQRALFEINANSARINFRAYDRAMVQVNRSSAQSIAASGVQNKIQFNATGRDHRGNWDGTNYRFVCLEPGLYEAVASTEYGALDNIDVVVELVIKKNTSTVVKYNRQVSDETLIMMEVREPVIELAYGDYLEVFTSQTCGSGKDISAGADRTWFSVKQII